MGAGQGYRELGSALEPAIGNRTAWDGESGRTRQGKRLDLQHVSRAVDPPGTELQSPIPARAQSEGKSVGEIDPPIVGGQLLRGPRGSFEKLRAEVRPGPERRLPFFVHEMARVQPEGMLNDQQGDLRVVFGVSSGSPVPDLEALLGRDRQKIHRSAIRLSARRRGVGFLPPVVVLASGDEELLPPGVLGEPVGRPQTEDPGGEMGVVVLGDHAQRGAVLRLRGGRNDHR